MHTSKPPHKLTASLPSDQEPPNLSQALATPNPTQPPNICALPAFTWHLNSAGPYCCPGVLDQPSGDGSKAYCCVGAPRPHNAVWTTTQASCATTVSVYQQEGYTSRVVEAASKYSVTYETVVGAENATRVVTATVGVTENADGTGAGMGASGTSEGVGAKVTAGAVLNGVLAVGVDLLLAV